MKDRTITQNLSMSGIRSGLKNELREAQTEVKLTKINGISQFQFTKIHNHFIIIHLHFGINYDMVERQCLSPSKSSR